MSNLCKVSSVCSKSGRWVNFFNVLQTTRTETHSWQRVVAVLEIDSAHEAATQTM